MGKNVRGGKMKKVFLKDKIEFIDEENDCIMGYVTFPKREDNTLDLNHTYLVAKSLAAFIMIKTR